MLINFYKDIAGSIQWHWDHSRNCFLECGDLGLGRLDYIRHHDPLTETVRTDQCHWLILLG